MEALHRRRRVVRRQLSRSQEEIERHDGLDMMDKMIERITAELLSIKEEFDGIQRKIEESCDDEQFEMELNARDDFERCHARLVDLVPTNKVTNVNSNANVDRSSNTNHSNNIRLPKLNLPSFSGQYSEWMNFHDLFNTVIHKNEQIGKVQKFQYLKGCLNGEASRVINSLPVTEANYDQAWELLVKRYDNKRQIITTHYRKLFNFPALQVESSSGLRHLLDNYMENMRALEVLEADNWDCIITQMLMDRLDVESKKALELTVTTSEALKFKAIEGFMDQRIQALEAASSGSKSEKVSSHNFRPTNYQGVHMKAHNSDRKHQIKAYHTAADNKATCQICKSSNHPIYQCNKFHQLNPNERLELVKEYKLCINCLHKGHFVNQCKASKCKVCQSSHHSLLHLRETNPNINPNISQQTISATSSRCQSQVLLATAFVSIEDSTGNRHQIRALLDSGSQSNFITLAFAKKLRLQKQDSQNAISGIGNSHMASNYQVSCNIRSNSSYYRKSITALAIPQITSDLPTTQIELNQWSCPNKITLADPTFTNVGPIDMLLGAEIFFEILRNGKIKSKEGLPSFQRSLLGWIAVGKINHPNSNKVNVLCCNLQDDLTKFWELEEITNVKSRSNEEVQCEEHFKRNTTRDTTGRFIVKLPFKDDPLQELGESRSIAEKRLKSLEYRLIRNPDLQQKYHEFMDEFQRLGHLVKVEQSEISEGKYYLPHHCVLKDTSSSTKLRVVFDASCKTTSGTSLNDILRIGPTIQSDLFSIVLRFRKYRYTLSADVVKMYRQILVHPTDHKFQRILWRKGIKEPIEEFKVTTVTYGTACAPYLATRCLAQLAEDEKEQFPKGSAVVLRDFYVDDVITGANTKEEIIKLQTELTALLRCGGFELRKWASNSQDVLKTIPQQHKEPASTVYFENTGIIKTLGLLWQPETDEFRYVAPIPELVPQWSKRNVLAHISRLFDPLGLVGPIVITAKVFIQELWQLNLTWDQILSDELSEKWKNILQDLQIIKELGIPRQVTCKSPVHYELHGFSDASATAFGACIYLRTQTQDGRYKVSLLCSKSRVAPLKRISIPRLELCGALLLARLAVATTAALEIEFSSRTFWTDSTIVLSWLAASSSRWKTFVANRVTEIQTLSTEHTWKHISTELNPADLISRGVSSDKLIHSQLWWNGPPFLSHNGQEWPASNYSTKDVELPIPDERIIVNVATTKQAISFNIFERFSKWVKLQRVTAFCVRFIHNSKPGVERLIGALSVDELYKAQQRLIKIVQGTEFAVEFKELTKQGHINQSNPLRSLCPFIDEAGIIRVGGRLALSNASYDTKHPILLPAHHKLTVLIANYEHLRCLHGGPTSTLTSIRQKYWPINGRNLARKVVHKCVRCFRTNPRLIQPLMGQLPSSRTTPARAFTSVGIDYGGPILLRRNASRKVIADKAYIAIFVCLVTRAIHIELVSSLTTDAFLATLKRFIARRGMCTNIYSDNASTFIGGKNQLEELNQFFELEETKSKVIDSLGQIQISWHFIPPRSPNFGGIWESGIKSIKHHLTRVTGNALLTFEEMYTVLVQIEAILNSRPLTPMSSDPNDLSALTPGHFLIGTSLTAPPEPGMTSIPTNRLSRYQLVTQLVQDFWKRWTKEYLPQMQVRNKWTCPRKNISVGDLVIIKEDFLPPLQWALGRIIDIHPGKDDIVRVVTVRTAKGQFKRSTGKLGLLPVAD